MSRGLTHARRLIPPARPLLISISYSTILVPFHFQEFKLRLPLSKSVASIKKTLTSLHSPEVLLNGEELKVYNLLQDPQSKKKGLSLFSDIKATANVIVWNRAIASLLTWQQMKHYYKEMKLYKISPDVGTLQIFANALYQKECTAVDVNELVSDLDNYSLKPTRSILHAFLYASAKRGLTSTVTKLWTKLQKQSSLDLEAYSLVLSGLSDFGKDLISLDKYYKMLTRARIQPTVGLIFKCMGAYERAGNLDHALMLFNDLKKYSIEPNKDVLYLFLQIVGQQNEWPMYREQLRELIELEAVNGFTFLKAIEKLGAQGKSQAMMSCFNAMVELKLQPERGTYTAVLNALAKEGSVLAVSSFTQIMEQQQIALDMEEYGIVLPLFSEKMDLATTLSCFHKMAAAGLKPDSRIYYALLCAFAKERDHGSMLQILTEMKERKITPSRLFYERTLKCFADSGGGTEDIVLSIFDELKRVCVPSPLIYHSLMRYFQRIQKPREVIRLFKEMKRMNIPPTESEITTIIEAFRLIDNVKEIHQLLVKQRDISLNKDILNRALNAYRKIYTNRKERALPVTHIKEKALFAWAQFVRPHAQGVTSNGPQPDFETYFSIMKIYGSEGDHEAVIELLRETFRFKFSDEQMQKIYSIVLVSHIEVKKFDQMFTMLTHMEEDTGIKPNETTFITIFRSLIQTENPTFILHLCEIALHHDVLIDLLLPKRQMELLINNFTRNSEISYEKLVRFFENMKKYVERTPDENRSIPRLFYLLIISVFAKINDPIRMISFYTQMNDQNILPTYECLNLMLNTLRNPKNGHFKFLLPHIEKRFSGMSPPNKD